jgi:hypothetical protein
VLYVANGSEGGLRVDDDDLEVSRLISAEGPDVGHGAVRWETERRSISSSWMDASHVHWYGTLLDQFKAAIAEDDFVGLEAQDSFRCIELITTAYRSAQEGSRELPLGVALPDGLRSLR